MPRSRLLLGACVVGLAVFVGHPRAEAPLVTTFYGIGDLPEGPGGVGSAVQDATRVDGTIYAVGSSTTYATGTVPTLDTPALWTLLAGSVCGTLTALPALSTFTLPPGFGAPNHTAYQITPSAVSDEAAGLVGGLGLAAGLSAGPDRAMAQATHGSAPDIAGKGIANPYAMIMSGQMLLAWLGHKHGEPRAVDAAHVMERAMETVIRERRSLTPDLGGTSSTSQMGAAVAAAVTDV